MVFPGLIMLIVMVVLIGAGIGIGLFACAIAAGLAMLAAWGLGVEDPLVPSARKCVRRRVASADAGFYFPPLACVAGAADEAEGAGGVARERGHLAGGYEPMPLMIGMRFDDSGMIFA